MPRSSSSSEDEDEAKLAQLREAAVTLDHLKSEAATSSARAKTKNESTNNKNNNEENDYDPFHLEVSPEFREFVAKKLDKKLDELISWTTIKNTSEPKKKSSDDLKLEILRNVYVDLSKTATECFPNESQTVKKQNSRNLNEIQGSKNNHSKKKKISHRSNQSSSDSDSSDEDMSRLKEAAIDVDFLIKTSCIEEHKKSLASAKQSN